LEVNYTSYDKLIFIFMGSKKHLFEFEHNTP